MNDLYVTTFFCSFISHMQPRCFFVRIRECQKHTRRHRDRKEQKNAFHSRKNPSGDIQTERFEFGGNWLSLSMSFPPWHWTATKFTMKSRSSPPPLHLPSIEAFRVHWWVGAEFLALCQCLCAIHSWPADRWIATIPSIGSLRVAEVETMLGRGSCPRERSENECGIFPHSISGVSDRFITWNLKNPESVTRWRYFGRVPLIFGVSFNSAVSSNAW